MTYEEFISYIKNSENLSEKDVSILKDITEKFPYFSLGHWLYLKTLKNTNSIYFGAELGKTAVFAPDRRSLYFFMNPEMQETKNDRERMSKDGNYFEMIEKFEKSNENSRQSLKDLAKKLKEARESFNLGEE
ncbi:MAG: hypothetical protein ACK5L7_02205 [Paludibacteraceae bacterium]